MATLKLFLIALAFRLFVGIFIVRTYFDPDEYWQSLEPAHVLVFGYGHLTWEWQPHARIRGWMHPLMFAGLYYVFRALGIDTPWLVANGPRALQALFAAAADIGVHRMALAIDPTKPRVARLAFLCHMMSWFAAYCGARTYSNSVEAQIAVVAISMLGLVGGVPTSAKRVLGALLAGITFVLRPTAAALWVIALPLSAWRASGRRLGEALRIIIVEMFPPVFAAIAAGALIDRLCYGAWTLVPFNFVYHNVFMSVAEFYGTHPWHWYFTQGLPAILLSYLVFLFRGVFLAWKEHGTPSLVYAAIALWVVLVHSVLSHKEFRFVLIAVPLLMPYCGAALNAELSWSSTWKKIRGVIAVLLLLLQIPLLLFFGLVHQRAPVAVMEHLRAQQAADGSVVHVDFLTPCHATPFYSHVHAPHGATPFKMTFLDCSPQFDGNMTTESDSFREHPSSFARDRYCCGWNIICRPKFGMVPSHVVAFVEPATQSLFEQLGDCGFVLDADFYHDHSGKRLAVLRKGQRRENFFDLLQKWN